MTAELERKRAQYTTNLVAGGPNEAKPIYTLTYDNTEKIGYDNVAMNHESPPEYSNIVEINDTRATDTQKAVEEVEEDRKSNSSSGSDSDREIITSSF